MGAEWLVKLTHRGSLTRWGRSSGGATIDNIGLGKEEEREDGGEEREDGGEDREDKENIGGPDMWVPHIRSIDLITQSAT